MTVLGSIFRSALLVLISLTWIVESTHVCIRYDIGGPCELMPQVLREAALIVPKVEGDPSTEYCDRACSEKDSYKFQDMCGCPTTTTTPEPTTTPTPTTKPCVTSYLENIACENNKDTLFGIESCDCPVKEQTLPDVCDRPADEATLCFTLRALHLLPSDTQCICYGPTTPDPWMCYYSNIRANGGLRRRKRINEGRAATNCEYPGIVGVFKNIGTSDQSSTCTGILVDESHILVSKDCAATMKSGMAIHVSSYSASDVTSEIKVDIHDRQQVLDIPGNALTLVGLKKEVTFDNDCVLPACLPSSLFSSSDIDFDNCSVVGYGATSDDFSGPQSDTLQEVKVSVDTDSLTSLSGMTVTRKDGSKNSNVACYRDDSAPVMCAHKDTNEWIVVGLYTTPGFGCLKGEYVPPAIANILQENPNIDYFSVLSKTRYVKS